MGIYLYYIAILAIPIKTRLNHTRTEYSRILEKHRLRFVCCFIRRYVLPKSYLF